VTEPPNRLGKYELRGTLGRGAMGVVYDGWDPIIARRVAIKTVKVPDPGDAEAMEELARFRREAQAAGRLTHPNIVAVYDYGEAEGVAYIVMEFVDGPTLKSLIEKQERMALPEIARVMDDVLAGLAFSHARGIVHRDIKPANVMLSSDGRAKIADFGIARIESSSMTQAGTVMGTPAYMSPEQFMGQTVDARTDIYSCGVLLYQLLTGERPFEGGMTAIMHKALNTEPPKPSELSVTAPPVLDAVVTRAMATRPEGRWPNAEAFAAAIRQAIAAPAAVPAEAEAEATMVAAPARPRPQPQAASVPEPAPTQPARKGLPLVPIAAGVVVLAALGGGAWFMLGGEAPDPAPAQVAAATAPLPAASAPLGQLLTQQPAPPPAGSATVLPPPAVPAPVLPSPPAPQAEPAQIAAAPTAPVPAAPPAAASTAPPATSPAAILEIPGSAPVQPRPASAAAPPPILPMPGSAPVLPMPGTAPTQPAPTPAATAAPPPPVAAPSTQPQAVQPAPSSPPQALALAPVTPPPVTPAPQPASLPSAAAVRTALASALPPVNCSLVSGSIGAERVTLQGVVGRGAPERALRQAIASASGALPSEWRVRSFDGPFCAALDTLRPAAQAFGAPGALSVTLAGDATRLRDGELVTVVLNGPDFASHLQVSFLVHDGTLAHLYPTPTDPARLLPAGGSLRLGDPSIGGPAWAVSPPYGTDLIIAVASSTPLFDKPRPDDEDVETYLRDLRAAIEQARRRGVRLAADAWLLETVAR
jgi:serine/threonine-protein kinase